MIIGFTGSQSGMNNFQRNELNKLFDKHNPDTLHHGDCIGADANCHYEFLRWHVKNDNKDRKIVIHPPLDKKKQAFTFSTPLVGILLDDINNCKHKVIIQEEVPYAYLERNRHIVDACSVIIATPKEVEHTLRSGTWATIRYSWKQKKETIIIPPLFAAGFGHDK